MARKDDVPIDPVTGGPAERANRLTYYAVELPSGEKLKVQGPRPPTVA